ncbi:amidohydrolase [Kribbella sp. NPDC050820]|uniref:M20 metallopeptidase family protein n=1 Tax=Kribbella sp. NPDC050820 TaxID=3155408 RepID=UPI0033F756F4
MTQTRSGMAHLGTQRVGADLLEEMTAWRRHLHAHPELGFEEHDTTAFIRSLLDEWGLPFDAPLSTATVAHARGQIPGPVLVVRADIDALPIQEENKVSYASTRPGVMHACGHDGHTAILLGLAKLLSRRRDRLRGEIRLLFQPAEELADGGAEKVIEAGAVNGAMAVVGLHLSSNLDTGLIGLSDGAIMASDDRFDITIVGNAGHASSPHQTTDALTIAAGLVSQLQTLVSRRIDPLSPAVVTVGSLHAGDAYNAIPGEARLSGTVRTLSPATRDLLETELVGLTRGYAAAHHAKAEVAYHRGSPPLINHSKVVEFARPAAEAAVGAHRVASRPPGMGAEDFAFYGEHLPSAFALIGAATETSFPHHHPRFDINEQALAVGLRFLQHLVERWAGPDTPAPDLHLS